MFIVEIRLERKGGEGVEMLGNVSKSCLKNGSTKPFLALKLVEKNFFGKPSIYGRSQPRKSQNPIG